MIKQRNPLVTGFIIMFAAVLLTTSSAFAFARAGHQVFYGIVRHVSENNIKVYNPSTKQTQSFLIVPHFGNVFKGDGRTPQTMKNIGAGQYVKVYYDQKFLGAFHADRILIMSSHDMKMGTDHS